jgi:S-DNA-T family DNA segregation ATPase FtsK/SpoIIIE
LITGLALTHSPRDAQFYCLDFGGGSLASIAGLPHVGGVADRHDADRVNRTIAELTGLLDQREQRFAAHGIQGMAAYRALRARHEAAGTTFDDPFDDPFGDVFIVVDGWFTLRQNFETGEAALRDLAGRALNYGIHLVLSTGRWSEVHHGMRDKIGTKLELRLGDPVESCINLRAAASVPRQPGRGLTEETLHFIAALPRIDGSGGTNDLADGVLDLVDAVRDCWSGSAVREVRMLPALLPAEQLPPAEVTAPGSGIRVSIGVDERALAPVQHDFGAVPHLTVLGDDASGKSNLLRLVARSVTECFTPDKARVMVVDYRRSLMDVVPPEHLLGYAMAPDAARALAVDAAAGLATRMPGPDIAPEQLRNRDWWTGPELFVLVDDYDLVAGHDNPLAPLLPYLPQAADVGLHVVLTRAAAGVMRLSMDPFLRRLHEISTPDLALSCPPGEGPLLGGVKPRHLPVGRAILCTRRGSRMIQTALSPAPVPVPA